MRKPLKNGRFRGVSKRAGSDGFSDELAHNDSEVA